MRIKYFTDTDTALVEYSNHQVAQTKEINENIYVDLDKSGNEFCEGSPSNTVMVVL